MSDDQYFDPPAENALPEPVLTICPGCADVGWIWMEDGVCGRCEERGEPAPTPPPRPHRLRRPSGAALLRQRLLDGFAATGTDPWLATEIAQALHVSVLSVRQALEVLAGEGHVEVVERKPYTVRRVR